MDNILPSLKSEVSKKNIMTIMILIVIVVIGIAVMVLALVQSSRTVIKDSENIATEPAISNMILDFFDNQSTVSPTPVSTCNNLMVTTCSKEGEKCYVYSQGVGGGDSCFVGLKCDGSGEDHLTGYCI